MDTLTRSQHPDLRLFTQVPGKLAWYSNRSYKTRNGVETHLYQIRAKGANRRGVEYSVIQDRAGQYRVLAKPVRKES